MSLNKRTYVLGEPLVAALTLVNHGTSPLRDLWFSYDATLNLKLQTEAGRAVEMAHEQTEQMQMLTRWEHTLAPGEKATTAFDLTRGALIGPSASFPKLAHMLGPVVKIERYVLSPGNYQLSAWFDRWIDRRPGVARPRFRTSSAPFTIRAPDEVERQALALFEQVALFAGPQAQSSQLAALEAYDRVWREYRQTPYAPSALYYSARLLQHRGYHNEALARYALLLEQEPKFPLMADLLYYQALALRDAGRLEQARDVGRVLAERHRNHLVAPDVPMDRPGSRIEILLSELGVSQSQ